LSYCDSDLFDISDLVFQSYQITVMSLSVIDETNRDDHMMCSEFIVVVRYGYQLLVVCDTFVFVAISLVSYFRCQISVVRYHRCQISVFSCQLSDYQLVLTSLVIGDISYS